MPSADSPAARIELPFPCLWIAPWSPELGTAPLRDTLNLTVLGADTTFVDRLLEEPSILNVFVGPHPTCWSGPGLPHDGYLANYLMTPKAFIDTESQS